jgi:hypothetical protein
MPNNKIPPEFGAWHASVSAMFVEIGAVAGFSPPRAMSDGFFALHEVLIESIPSDFAHLIAKEAGDSDWLARFRYAVLTSVQEGLYASLYHLHRVEGMENEILAIAKRHAPTLGMPLGSGAGGGNTRARNCEYQAFAFATRRTLEYLGVAGAAFFKTDCHSIKKLHRAIEGREPHAKSGALQELLAERLGSISDLLPDDKHNSRFVARQIGSLGERIRGHVQRESEPPRLQHHSRRRWAPASPFSIDRCR